MNLLNKKVAVIGMGIVGEACVKYLLKRGVKITIRDKQNTNKMKERIATLTEGYNVHTILGKEYLAGLSDANIKYDFVVLAPGINPHQSEIEHIKKAGIQIHNDITLFLEEWSGRGTTIGITGSNGKSTVATIIYELLVANKLPAKLGGNIGISPLGWLNENLTEDTTVVIEVSSYSLELFTKKHFFDTFILTNISENHLDRYPLGIENYTKTKLKGTDSEYTTFITNIDDKILYEKVILLSECKKILPISLYGNIDAEQGIFLTKDRVVIYQDSYNKNITLLKNINERKIKGTHNAYDILYALAAISAFPSLLSINNEIIKNFNGLPHRTEFIAKINEITYINDSKSTSPDATKKALSSTTAAGKNIILIAGGKDKGSSFETLKEVFEKYVKMLVLLPGDASSKIEKIVKNTKTKILNVKNMKEAVLRATSLSKIGDTVLLSPATASFNSFKNFEERGEQFIKEVNQLK